MLFGGDFEVMISSGKKARRESVSSSSLGRNLDHDALQAGLMDCKAEKLRFRVGDRVYANIGEFTEGKF